ncbi:translation initiation factor IF-2 [Candidatus Dependentiae bacterium]|nr:translation initiation factor IF-2 [Candidatus Dependentiae bacterium]
MRVYEFAKQQGLASKEILAELKSGGIALPNHMAVLSPEALEYLEKKYNKSVSKAVEKKPAASKNAKVAAPKQIVNVNTKIESEKKAPQEALIAPHKSVAPIATHTKATAPLLTKPHQGPISNQRPTHERVLSFEEEEDAELREQERIKRLISTSALVGLPAMGQQGPRRRRRRKARPAPVREAPRLAVTQATIESSSMTVADIAKLFGKQPSEIIMMLLKKGMVCNLNAVVNQDVVRAIGESLNIAITFKAPTTGTQAPTFVKKNSADGTTRAPIVVVMGHVDHGKTTLLDFVRKMNIAASEKGGITQHLRAWEVSHPQGKLVFLDTPGHEAFSYMRQQGSKITDIAILVVAADDGIMPQTIEALEHAKRACVPIIVAINKIDKISSPSAIETIKRQLAQHDLMPEDWGGQTIIAPISAKTGQGVDHLLDMVLLQSQMMDLKATTDKPAHAFILESHVEKGLGAVATVIARDGVLRVGDYFTVGTCTGKIRILIDTFGKKITEAGPSVPVQLIGFDSIAGLGDELTVVNQAEYSKMRSQKVQAEQTFTAPQMAPIVTAQKSVQKAASPQKAINLIVKTDTRGSKEAVMGSIDKVVKANKEIKCPIVIVNSGIGDITEGDIELAEGTDSIILGLHVKVEKNALSLAKEMGVKIELYGIIYEMVEYLSKLLQSKKEIQYTWNKVGEANVLKVFDIKGIGIIAGCYARDGVISRGNKVECIRGNKKIGEGKITSLQRDRKTVKEVHAGYECGFTVEGFNEWQEGDAVLCYAETKVD